MNRSSLTASFAFLLFLYPAIPAQASVQSLPPGALLAVDVEQPIVLYNLLQDMKLPESPEIKGFFAAFGAIGTDRNEVLRKLAGEGIVYASYAGDATLTIADGEDPAATAQVRQLMQVLAVAKNGTKGVFYQTFPGGASWSLDGKLFWASAGKRIAISARADLLKALFTPNPKAGMAHYAESRESLGGGAAATFYVNMEALNGAPAFRKGIAGDGSAFDIILGAAFRQSLLGSKWAAMNVRVQGKNLVLHAACDGALPATGPAAFSIPGKDQGPLPNLTVPNQIAAISLWRDLGKFYADKDNLFPEKTSGGILFENFMEIFFSGRDLNAEVFSRFHPEVRLVAARQEFDPKIGTPHDKYPAAALIFRIDNAEEFGELAEEAWQKAVGITNFTRGQQALPGLIINRETHGGVTFTYSYYSSRSEKDRANLPVRFNMRPSIARAGQYLILSTTDGLAKDVIDAVNREDNRMPAVRGNEHTVLEFSSGEDLANLIPKNPTDPKADSPATQAMLRQIDHARLSLAATAKGTEAKMEVRLK